MDAEAREWILSQVSALRQKHSELEEDGTEVRPLEGRSVLGGERKAFDDALENVAGAVQGVSFIASATAVRFLQRYGIVDLRIESSWRGSCSERLLGIASALLFGDDPARCALEGDMMFAVRSQGSAFGTYTSINICKHTNLYTCITNNMHIYTRGTRAQA